MICQTGGYWVNAYDFDGTICRGDSSFAFYRFVLLHHPSIARYWPAQICAFFRYVFGRTDKTEMKQAIFSFLRQIDGPAEVDLFWKKSIRRIEPWYLAKKKPDDLIISASPEFLLRPVCEKLGVCTLLASKVDPNTGRFEGKNCHGKEKVRRYRERFGESRPESFYSDSRSDEPMAKLARKAFLVKKGRIRAW